MKRALFAAAFVFGAIGIEVPAVADEFPIQPVKHAQESKQTKRAEPAPRDAAPARSQQASWSGAQIGGQGGVSGMAQGFAEPGASQCFRDHALAGSPIELNCAETPFNFSSKFQARASGGGSIGYNFQFGTMVIGFEADLSQQSGSSSAAQPAGPVVNGGFGLACPGCFSTRTESFNGSVTQGWDSSYRMRFGYLVTPMTMVYFTGGAAVEKVSGSFSYAANTVNNIPGTGVYQDTTTGSGSWSQTKSGWTVGGGAEYAVGGGWKARVEYRYSDYGNLTANVPLARSCGVVAGAGCFTPNSGSTNARIDLGGLSSQAVKVGFAFSL
jgi:outer membrane immunogenic protein